MNNKEKKLKGYSIWVCGNCHTKFFIDKEPSLKTWKKLADFFGTTVSYLQGEDTILKARDLFLEISILADLYPGLENQLKALEDENNLYFGYENLQGSKSNES